jgi:hypothetical protein
MSVEGSQSRTIIIIWDMTSNNLVKIPKFRRKISLLLHVCSIPPCKFYGSLGWRSGQGNALLVGSSRGRSPVVSLGIFSEATDKTMCPGVDSASKNEYQENSWGWRRPVCKADDLTTFIVPKDPGALTSWNPKSHVRLVVENLYLFTWQRMQKVPAKRRFSTCLYLHLHVCQSVYLSLSVSSPSVRPTILLPTYIPTYLPNYLRIKLQGVNSQNTTTAHNRCTRWF